MVTTGSIVKKPGTRKIKADETRRALISAAATVVGRHGYEGASIAKITESAGVANGTFYNYFNTRQDLFDQLLPAVGDSIIDYIRSRLDRGVSGAERERQRIVAYFEFVQQNRGFLRIKNEAEVYAPRAFKQHIQKFAGQYIKALARQLNKGEMKSIREDELEAIAYMLLGAATYLTMLWRSVPTASRKQVCASLVSTYEKLVTRGLFATGHGASRSRGRNNKIGSAPARSVLLM